ncbi:MAG TPA: cytochrome C oxidase subunit IV family protein [Dyella sp.]|uniref:cytochrome C oxidase subunit IV family protein n=1 Tax=Dyella sp. TaxID=1869338 RepID=UPI002F933547
MSSPPSTLRSHWGALIALFILLVATAAFALLPLGAFNTVVALGISLLKMLIVMVYFMRIRESHPFVRVVAMIGFIWLAMLVGFSLTDYLARLPVAVG